MLLYRVKVDSGIAVDQAKEIFDDAMNDATIIGSTEHDDDGFIGIGCRSQINTGFYIDRRSYLKKTPKVFLVINKSSVSLDKKIVVIRPNQGRGSKELRGLYNDIHVKKVLKFCDTEAKIEEALRLWDKEFKVWF